MRLVRGYGLACVQLLDLVIRIIHLTTSIPPSISRTSNEEHGRNRAPAKASHLDESRCSKFANKDERRFRIMIGCDIVGVLGAFAIL